jgi:diguanylate cyclase (GGDEF)-like protein
MKILVADDDPVFLRELEALLVKWHYEVVAAADGLEAWQALGDEGAPRLAILDWMMPGKDGLEICREMRQTPQEPYTYILLLTARGEKRDVVAGLEAGADDYLTKPFDAAELRARLRAGRRILALQEALLSARDALRFRSAHDPLTGLWNRVGVLETLARELVRSERQGTCLSVVMADLDGFQRVNGQYGYMAGDEALRETARRLQDALRAWDAVGRYGGEEFLMVLPETDAGRGQECADRLRAAISGKPMDVSGGSALVTFSAGGATLEAGQRADAGALVRAAGEALERAKNQGGNAFAWASGAELVRWAAQRARPSEGRQRRHQAPERLAKRRRPD